MSLATRPIPAGGSSATPGTPGHGRWWARSTPNPSPSKGRGARAAQIGASAMTSSNLHSDAFVLDAAAPFISPWRVDKHLDDLRAAGADGVNATVASSEDCRTTMERLGAWLEIERTARFPLRLARSVADMRQAKQDDMLAVVFHLQGTDPIERDIDLIDAYHALGVRVIQLTYNARNLVGDGCLEPGNAGLSAFGRRVVQRIADL